MIGARRCALLKQVAQEPLDTDAGKITASFTAREYVDATAGRLLAIYARKPTPPHPTMLDASGPTTLGARFRLTEGRWMLVDVFSTRPERYRDEDPWR